MTQPNQTNIKFIMKIQKYLIKELKESAQDLSSELAELNVDSFKTLSAFTTEQAVALVSQSPVVVSTDEDDEFDPSEFRSAMIKTAVLALLFTNLHDTASLADLCTPEESEDQPEPAEPPQPKCLINLVIDIESDDDSPESLEQHAAVQKAILQAVEPILGKSATLEKKA